MSLRASLALLLTLVSLTPGRAGEANALVLTGATVYPAPDQPKLPDAVVVIAAGRIVAVGPRGSVALPAGVRSVDCAGKFITAGFWNSHVHLLAPPLLAARTAPAATLAPHLDAMFNRWGFTTVFDIASPLAPSLALRDRIAHGELRGPRILTTGDPLWTRVPVYVRAYLAAHNVDLPEVTTPDNAAARVAALASGGVNGIKLFTGSVQEGAVANMSLEFVRAATAAASARRLPVFAHPQNTPGLEVAIAGGVDILAHTAPQSPSWTPEFVARLKAANIALIPTLTLYEVEGRRGGVPPDEIQRWVDHGVGELRAFAAGGGEVLFGTDIGYIDHHDTTQEFRLMAKAGLDFPRILAALTTAPAARFGFGERSGRVAPGFDADLVVLDRDPAADLAALAQVRATIRAGEYTYQAD